MGYSHAPQPWVGYWTPQGVWVDSPAQTAPRSVPWAWLLPLGLILVGGAFLAAGVAKRLG